MFRLTREVRFAIGGDGTVLGDGAHNGYAADPPLDRLGHYFALQLTLAGQLNPRSNYLLNIKEVDQRVRQEAVPLLQQAVRERHFGGGAQVMLGLHTALCRGWPNASLEAVHLLLSPFLSLAVLAREHPMVRLSQHFEFSASHRLFNPGLGNDENLALFGKCSNPHGHGHNYELQVTVKGEPDDDGVVIPVPVFERIVMETVIDRFDHRNLNVEVPEFRDLIPSVENIAAVIYRLLKPRFAQERAVLASVTVWETPKTWCEYSEA